MKTSLRIVLALAALTLVGALTVAFTEEARRASASSTSLLVHTT